MRGHLQFVYQVYPIVFQRLSESLGIPARNIVFDGERPPGFPGRSHDVLEYHIAVRMLAPNGSHKALYQNSVQPVLAHPAEVAAHGLLIPRGEQIRRLSTQRHAGDFAPLIGIELAEIGVHLDGQTLDGRNPTGPMSPAPRAILRT